MREGRSTETSALRDYLHVARRRKWIILGAVVIAPVVAVFLASREQHLYRASAQVLLSHQNLGQTLTGTPSTADAQPDRTAKTQADLANVPTVAARVLQVLKLKGRTVPEFAIACGASAASDADILNFSCTDPVPVVAAQLATEYARQYTLYRRELDTQAIERARLQVSDRMAVMRQQGEQNTALYANLAKSEQQLATMEALQSAPATVVRTATRASQVQPRPTRNGILGLALGLVIGLGLAFLREALDTRVRTAEEIAERLQLPLLARLPEPPRRLRADDQLVMLAEPNGVQAEAFRMLRTNLEFANLERGSRTIMVTSAVEAEGKSTTVANLAIAFARAGRRVVLVDLDLRRPYLDRFFKLGNQPGLTHVALGRVDLEEALVPIALTEPSSQNGGDPSDGSSNGRGRVTGVLEVLLSGPLPPNAGEFAASRALGDILERLRERADLVLVDAPPLLRVNDAMALSAKVDGIIVVSRLAVARRPILDELRRVLGTCPAAKLGFALTGADLEADYYGYGGYYARAYTRKDRETVS